VGVKWSWTRGWASSHLCTTGALCADRLSSYADIGIVRLMPISRLCRHAVGVRSEALAVAGAPVVSGPARSA
jgi:hypothetical protein